MFWEIPDDPRGALRWSVSRLRAIVDDGPVRRILADRESVAFRPEGMAVDLDSVRSLGNTDLRQLPAERIAAAAALFRGEFLEGLDLPNQHDFQAWCVAEREDLRRLQAALLGELMRRYRDEPGAALGPARQLVQIDPFNEGARVELLRLLLLCGRRQEAESHFETAARLFRDIGQDAADRLERAFRQMRRDFTAVTAPAPDPVQSAPQRQDVTNIAGLVGRTDELRRLAAAVETTRREGRARLVLLLGEPGLGKSRLMQEIAADAASGGVRVLSGRSYDAGLHAAFGPWIEALGAFPAQDPASGREQLFATLAAKVIGDAAQPVLLILEDFHWSDEASAELLHHVVRAGRGCPLTVVLTAREGELPDNLAVGAVLRSLRRDIPFEEIRLQPMGEEEMRQLIGSVAPEADAGSILKLSGGNPLYALEIARHSGDAVEAVPRPLKELVRDRVDRLPEAAAELLRWASVLGPVVEVENLLGIAEPDLAALTRLLEVLERHALLAPMEGRAGAGTYVFSHELVRQAIYTGLSEPRRRLMHLKVAQLLATARSGTAALDIAHHAAAGGDARMAAEACVEAGRHCVRLFANSEALRLSRQGQTYAADLPEPLRTECLVGLTEIEARVDRPADPAELVGRIEALAENALDHGRPDLAGRCYIMIANLRWEGGHWSDAQLATLRGELVSRASDERGRVVALAEAARCLAMLERDLGTAESLVLEAEAIARRIDHEPDAIADAQGLLHSYRGEYAEAARLFQKARMIARRDGERAHEFLAAEHLLTLEMELGNFADALRLCDDIIELAGRFRSGSEHPFATAMQALCRLALHGEGDGLEAALAELRRLDAKHRLAFAASTAAKILLERGNPEAARVLALEALAAATLLNRHSDMAMALSVLVRPQCGDGEHLDRLAAVVAKGVSSNARQAAEAAMAMALSHAAPASLLPQEGP